MMKKRTERTVCCAAFAYLLVAPPAAAQETLGEWIGKISDAFEIEGEGWDFKVKGRAQVDFSFAESNTTDLDVNDLDLRRSRLGFESHIGRRLFLKTEFDVEDSGDATLQDAFFDFKPIKGFKIRAGQQRTQNSLDEQTSSNFSSTLERAAFTDAFLFDRRVGVSAEVSGEKYSFSAGIFGTNVEDETFQDGFAVAARAVYTPVNTEDLITHIGASVRFRNQNVDTEDDLLEFSQPPFTDASGDILSTGLIADEDLFIGGEFAAIRKSFWLAGEYGVTFAKTPGIPETQDFEGWYAEVGYFLGGRRTYSNGRFTRPKVYKPVSKGGAGAFAFVVRYDSIDLSDSGIDGGEQDTLVVGVDWWSTRYTRLSVNYFNVDASLGTTPFGLDSPFAALVSAGTTADTVNGVTIRWQFDF